MVSFAATIGFFADEGSPLDLLSRGFFLKATGGSWVEELAVDATVSSEAGTGLPTEGERTFFKEALTHDPTTVAVIAGDFLLVL